MNEKMCKLLKIAQDIWAVLPSLPSRERGLKSAIVHLLASIPWSLPSRERGLKFRVEQRNKISAPRRSPRGSVD